MTDFDPLAPITPAQADALRRCTTKEEAEAVLGRRICAYPLKKGPKPFRYAPFDLCPRWPSLGATCPRHPVKGIAHPQWTTGKSAKRRKKGGRTPEAEKAQAVVLAALTTESNAARVMGVAQQSVSQWARGIYISEGAVKLVQELKDKIAKRIYALAEIALDEGMEEQIKVGTIMERLAMVDRIKVAQLITNEPTENIAGSLTDEARAALREAIRAKANDKPATD